ncbi:hypothetical protein SteCoe_8340 [Stentor coeruleus]|uniref:Uncharacterized protein n=1 Tax=Stentor coeruleus TaxID=5963 RepID=A0A1R2CKP4_9CILI|nr:hypothetical protein SteCoe_8340 [Stentor coeruleus]
MDSYFSNAKIRHYRQNSSRLSSRQSSESNHNFKNTPIFLSFSRITKPTSTDQTFFTSQDSESRSSTPIFLSAHKDSKKISYKHYRKSTASRFSKEKIDDFSSPESISYNHYSSRKQKSKILNSERPNDVDKKHNKNAYKFKDIRMKESPEKVMMIEKLLRPVTNSNKPRKSSSGSIRKKISVSNIRREVDKNINEKYTDFHQKSKDLLFRLKRSIFGIAK